MRKIIASALILACTALPLSSFAFAQCKIGDSNFCRCFINNCKLIFPAGSCTASHLKHLIKSTGVNSVCAQEQPGNMTQCIAATGLYISSSSPCH